MLTKTRRNFFVGVKMNPNGSHTGDNAVWLYFVVTIPAPERTESLASLMVAPHVVKC